MNVSLSWVARLQNLCGPCLACHVQLFNCSTVQMFKCSNVQLFNCSNVQLFKCSNVQLFKCSNLPNTTFTLSCLTGSPSRGGNVAVYAFDINQMSLPTPFYSALVSASVFVALSTAFHSINSPDNSPLSHSVLPVFSALLVLPTIYLLVKVLLSPDMILCG